MTTRISGAVLASFVAWAALGLAAGHGSGGARAAAPSLAERKGAVARVWHGKTPRAKADEYERYLTSAVAKFPSIAGNLGYQVMRLDGGPDGDAFSEFQVISYWESLDAIHAYAGADVRRTRDLPRDREFLVDMEPYVRNYELRVNALRP